MGLRIGADAPLGNRGGAVASGELQTLQSGVPFHLRGRSASTGGRRSSLRVEVVTHLVKLVALLVVITADDNYAIAA